jgi:signal transduction histidine kinase/CheY-like chemotaxis protein
MLKLNPRETLTEARALRAELAVKTVWLSVVVLFLMAIYLVDMKPVSRNATIGPAISTVLILSIVVSMITRESNISWTRWLPFVEISILPLLLIWLYRSTDPASLILISIMIAPILFNLRVGILVSLLHTAVLLFVVPRIAPASIGFGFCTILTIWFILAALATILGFLFEIVSQLIRSYDEGQELLQQARQAQADLNQLVKERTEANLQLARLNQLSNSLRVTAEEERRIKEVFVANVSHELRTPLNMIIGYCEVMLQSKTLHLKKLPASLQDDLEVILRNSQHLSNLINDILDLSQINAGQMAIAKEITPIQTIIDEAVLAVRPLFESKNLYLQTEVPGALPDVFCDRTRIREVLLNLLSNAARFTVDGGVILRAMVEQESLVVHVTDTGIGISKEKQERLFDPFYQADSSIRKKYGGTGLGLSISKKIIELHNGRITVDSEEGKGTTFTFYLPIQTQPYPAGSYRRWFNPYETEHRPPSHPLPESMPVGSRVVVVDSDGSLVKLFKRYLGAAEYVAVASLDEGLQDIQVHPTRMMIINTTDLSGTLALLRQAEPLPYRTPVIVCSIPNQQNLRGQMDLFDILVKPISQQALFQSLEKLQTLEEGESTILIVDDEPEVRQLFKRMLAPVKKYHVLTAGNSVHALQVMKHQKIDLVLLDLTMPEMNGYEFLEAKKKLVGCEDVPVILISGHLINDYPVVSDGLSVVIGGGLSIAQFLESLNALTFTLLPDSPGDGSAAPGSPAG